MKLVIEVDCGNDAFNAAPVTELKNILSQVFNRAGETLEDLPGMKLVDSNGNTVGKITLDTSQSDDEVRQEFLNASKATDPVYLDSGKWWFYDETWTHSYGPYLSKQQAVRALQGYCVKVLGFTSELTKLKENRESPKFHLKGAGNGR